MLARARASATLRMDIYLNGCFKTCERPRLVVTTSVVEGVVTGTVISAVDEVSGASVTVVSKSSLVLLISLVPAVDVDSGVVPTVDIVVVSLVVGAGVPVVSGSGFMRTQPQDLSQ